MTTSIWSRLRDDPRALIERAAAVARARWQLRGCTLGTRVHALGRVDVRAEGAVRLGDRVGFVDGPLPTSLRVHRAAELTIADDTLLNYGVSIEAHASIRIGSRCMLASFVRLEDRDEKGVVAPITIGDDVWIAHGALVLGGVTIGDGSVVSANSVVTRDVPPRMLAIGNPARAMPLAALSRSH